MIKTFAITCFLFNQAPLLASVVSDSELRQRNDANELEVLTDQFSEHGILFIETKSAPKVAWSKSRLTVTFPNSHYTGPNVDLRNKSARSIRLSTRKQATILKITTRPKLVIRDYVDIVQSGNGWQITVSERPFSANYRRINKKVRRSPSTDSSPQSLEQLSKILSDSGDVIEDEETNALDPQPSNEHLAPNGSGQFAERNGFSDNDETKSESEFGDNSAGTSPKWAIDSSSELATKPPTSTVTSFIAITLVLSILGLAAFLFQRFRQQSPFTNRSREFEIIERIVLGHRQQVVRLRIGQSDLILGVTEHNISPLGDFASFGQRQPSSASSFQPNLGRSTGYAISSNAPHNVPSDIRPRSEEDSESDPPATNSRVDEFKAKLANALTRESSDHHTPRRTKAKTIPAYRSRETLNLQGPNSSPALDNNEDPIWTRKNIA